MAMTVIMTVMVIINILKCLLCARHHANCFTLYHLILTERHGAVRVMLVLQGKKLKLDLSDDLPNIMHRWSRI